MTAVELGQAAMFALVRRLRRQMLDGEDGDDDNVAAAIAAASSSPGWNALPGAGDWVDGERGSYFSSCLPLSTNPLAVDRSHRRPTCGRLRSAAQQLRWQHLSGPFRGCLGLRSSRSGRRLPYIAPEALTSYTVGTGTRLNEIPKRSPIICGPASYGATTSCAGVSHLRRALAQMKCFRAANVQF